MSLDNIPINSGTGPNVAVDNVSTENYQIVKVIQGDLGTTGSMSVWTVSVSGTASVSVANTPTVNIGNSPAVTVSNAPTVTVSNNVSITGDPGVVQTAHSSAFNAFAAATTSSSAILKTSGSHTLYITDLMFSVDVPMNIAVRSATTKIAEVFLATKGGFVFPTQTPFIMNSAESLTFLPSTSGSCAGYAAGYTVT